MRGFLVVILLLLIVALVFSIRHDRQVAEAERSFTIDSTSTYSSSPSSSSSDDNDGYKYVAPYITRTGKYVKGHVRKPVSTDPNAYKNQARSRYYYETHKRIIKERRKKKN
jgi:hypothetical protein